MKNIFEDGYEIERNGEAIKLTRQEINEINSLIQASYGHGSVEYYIDMLDEEEPDYEIKLGAAEALLEDTDACYSIWDDYWDRICYDGEDEYDAVDDAVMEYISEHFED